MTHNTRKTKIFMFALGLVMFLALMLGIVFASPTFAVYAAGEDGTAPTIVKTGGIDVDRKNHMGTLPNALKGVEYKAKDGSNYKIEATGTEPFTFRANKSGEGYAPLPEGLSLNSVTGEIVGTPTGDAGKYNISVTVTNKYGSDNISVGMYVYGETSKPKITTTQADIAVGYVDSSYSQRIVYESGIGEPSEARITNGNLPTELRLRQAGFGIYIEGKPTEEGTFTFTVHVENSAGFDEKQYTITIQKGYQSPKIINKDDIRRVFTLYAKWATADIKGKTFNKVDATFVWESEAVKQALLAEMEMTEEQFIQTHKVSKVTFVFATDNETVTVTYDQHPGEADDKGKGIATLLYKIKGTAIVFYESREDMENEKTANKYGLLAGSTFELSKDKTTIIQSNIQPGMGTIKYKYSVEVK